MTALHLQTLATSLERISKKKKKKFAHSKLYCVMFTILEWFPFDILFKTKYNAFMINLGGKNGPGHYSLRSFTA